jgi:NADPH:quinone reductase-like Zn-dependent oxidoreductase
MMKAIMLRDQGTADNLVLTELPIPQPGPDEVLVAIHALSVNPVDIKTRKGGALYAALQQDGPAILGWDISGVVLSVGPNVSGFRAGDAVFGMVRFPGHGKAYAEYVTAPADHLALKPENCSHEEAAAATLAALTAWQVLVQEAGIREGQHLLMHAAAGGVGHYAVQIAKQLGARVTGTASAANAAYLKALGVDTVIDYTSVNFEDEVQDVDIVFDPIGGETTRRSLTVLKEGGTLISIVGGVKEPLQPLIGEKRILAKNYLVHSSGADMEQLAALMREGKLRSTVSHTFPFEDMAAAHRQIETGRTRGKVVVTLPAAGR